jgi:8-oxo-dGTP pyrophosphatase MutT (NUDIX family)
VNGEAAGGAEADGVSVLCLAGDLPLRILIEPSEPTPGAAGSVDVDRVWEELCAANPRLFDGPILSVVGIDVAGACVRARRDSYKRLAVQPRAATGVELLSVTGILSVRVDDGAQRFLLGRRGRQTRSYPGLWELGPSGGIDPPADRIAEMDEAGIAAQLRREIREEIGFAGACEVGRPRALLHDRGARSWDVVMPVAVDASAIAGGPGAEHRWEYEQVAWHTRAELLELARTRPQTLIPPTLALIARLDALTGAAG